MGVRSLMRSASLALVIAFAMAAQAQAGTQRASVSSAEEQSDSGSVRSVLSGNGQFVAFESQATNLVPGDTNGVSDIFVRDLAAGTTERVSVSTDEAQADPSIVGSVHPDISADGRFVVFHSGAGNLSPGDTNGAYDVFIRDRLLGETHAVTSVPFGGSGAFQASVSDDGRYVAFDSLDELAGDETGNPDADIFVRDLQAGTIELIGGGNSDSDDATISSDGRWVAFATFSNNLIAGDAGDDWDVYLVDRDNDTVERVTLKDDETEPTGYGGNLPGTAISDNGRLVAFTSSYTDLLSNDDSDSNTLEIAVRDLAAGATERIDVSSDETPSNSTNQTESLGVSMSGNGRYVGFSARSTNLVPGDTFTQDAFVRDRTAGTTQRFSVSSEGAAGDVDSANASVSDDGSTVSFDSGATNLVPGDTNGFFDTFVRQPIPPGGATVTIRKDAVPNNAQDFSFTATGTGLSAFTLDDDSVEGPPLAQKTFEITAAQLGPKTVTETATGGWTLAGIVCTGDDNSSTAGPTATLDVDAGEQIVCTYTNNRDPTADLEVDALTVPDQIEGATFQRFPTANNFGPDDAAGATLTIDGTNVVVDSFDEGVMDCSAPNAADLSCTIGVFPEFGSRGATVDYSVPNPGPASITVTVSSPTFDPDLADRTQTANFTVTPDTPPDTDPPQTTIDGPTQTKNRKPTFTLSSDEPVGATFECSLDGKPFKPCDVTYKPDKKLKIDKHTLEARATDLADNTDPTPAEHKVKIKK